MYRTFRCLIAPVTLALAMVSASASAATLTGSRINPPFPAGTAYPGFPDYTKVNLTTLGTIDWIRVGEATTAGFGSTTGFNDKSGGTAISGYTQSGVLSSNSGGFHYLSYTDGTAPSVSTDYAAELTASGGFSFNVAASSSQTRELLFFGAVYGSSTGHFTAQLFNSANVAISSAFTNDFLSTGAVAGIYKLDFLGNSAGDYLAVNFSKSAGTAPGDYISFSAATLTAAPAPAPAPLPPAFATGLVLLGVAGAVRVVRAKLG